MAHIAERNASQYVPMIYGLQTHLLPRPAPGRRLPGRSPPDLVLRGAADLGEAEGGAGDRLRGRVRRGRKEAVVGALEVGMKKVRAEQDGVAPPELAARIREGRRRGPLRRCARGSASTRSRRSTSAPRRRRARCSSSSTRSGSRSAELWGMSETSCDRDPATRPERITVGTGRQAGAGGRAEAGRGRRGPRPRRRW